METQIKTDKAVELLKKLRHCYLHYVDVDGEPETPLMELLEIWKEVNQVINDHEPL